MATSLLNFPLAQIVDGMLSFIQHRFSKPELTPSEYRYSRNDRESRIRIGSSYVIDNEKPGSRPSITVERGPFKFANATFDNLKTADVNTFENPHFRDWLDGTVNIICESRVPSEASSLANYLAIELQANHKILEKTLRFLKGLKYLDISPETPTKADVEVRTWRVTLRLQCSIYIGYLKKYDGPTIPFNKLGIIGIAPNNPYESTAGFLYKNQSLLMDNSANFGIGDNDNPKFLQSELDGKWYYVTLGHDTNKTTFVIDNVVNGTTLSLKYRDGDGNLQPYLAPEDKDDVSYNVEWNSAHLHVELPTNT